VLNYLKLDKKYPFKVNQWTGFVEKKFVIFHPAVMFDQGLMLSTACFL